MSSSLTVENDINGRRAFEVSSDGMEDDNRRGREPPAPPPSDDGNNDDVDDAPPPPLLLSHLDHLLMASRVAPLWFLSNYSYAVSLRWMSITSLTVLALMGSVFAFAFATCTRYGGKRATGWKVAGVALCFAGGGCDRLD